MWAQSLCLPSQPRQRSPQPCEPAKRLQHLLCLWNFWSWRKFCLVLFHLFKILHHISFCWNALGGLPADAFCWSEQGFCFLSLCLGWFPSSYAEAPWCESLPSLSFTLLIFSSNGACAACLKQRRWTRAPASSLRGTCSRQHLLTAVSVSPWLFESRGRLLPNISSSYQMRHVTFWADQRKLLELIRPESKGREHFARLK